MQNRRRFPIEILILAFIISACSLQSDLSSLDEYRYKSARDLYENGNYETALTLFTSLVNEMPWSSKVDESRYYIGKSHIELSQDETFPNEHLHLAISSLNQVGDNSSVKVKAQYETGYAYYKMNSFDSSSLYLNEVYRNFPHSSRADDALLFLAHIDIKQGDRESGLRKYREIIGEYSSGNRLDNALYSIAETHLYTAEDTINDYIVKPEYLKYALDTFELVDAGSTLWDDAQFGVGYCYYKMESYDNALSQFNFIYGALKSSNRVDDAALYVGHVYRKQDLPDEALIWYQKVVEQFPGRNAYDNALYRVGDYYYDRKLSGDELEQESNRLKAVKYFSRFCEIADKTSEKYQTASGKLENLGVEK